MKMRDPRAINRMDDETKAIHLRLEAWGRWAREDGNGVGWPGTTLLGRVMEQGANGASQSGKPPVTMPDGVALTDAAVARLGAVDRGVVVAAYVLPWEPPERLWRRCRGIRSLGNFRIVLKRARWRVAGFLDGVMAVCVEH